MFHRLNENELEYSSIEKVQLWHISNSFILFLFFIFLLHLRVQSQLYLFSIYCLINNNVNLTHETYIGCFIFIRIWQQQKNNWYLHSNHSHNFDTYNFEHFDWFVLFKRWTLTDTISQISVCIYNLIWFFFFFWTEMTKSISK